VLIEFEPTNRVKQERAGPVIIYKKITKKLTDGGQFLSF
jgi:hypothetical protein